MSENNCGRIPDKQMIDDLAAECARLEARIRELRAENEGLKASKVYACKDCGEDVTVSDVREDFGMCKACLMCAWGH